MDDADKRESDAAEQTPPEIKAEDNPWYLRTGGWFGPSNYEECVLEKMKGQSEYMLGTAHDACRAKFKDESKDESKEVVLDARLVGKVTAFYSAVD